MGEFFYREMWRVFVSCLLLLSVFSSVTAVHSPDNEAKSVTEMFNSLYTTWQMWCSPTSIRRWNTNWAKATVPVSVVEIAEGNRGRAMVGLPKETDPETILIAFRGVSEPMQYLQTGKFWKTDFYGTEVHSGFLTNYKALEPGLVRGVRKALRVCPRCNKLHMTGYSMGGALAQLAIVDLRRKFPQLCGSIITFGSPRVGNKDFAQKLFPDSCCGTSRRVVHKGDRVAHLPPQIMGYRHVAFEWWNPGTSPSTRRSVIRNCDRHKRYGDTDRCSNSYHDFEFLPDHKVYLGIEFDKMHGCDAERMAQLEDDDGYLNLPQGNGNGLLLRPSATSANMA